MDAETIYFDIGHTLATGAEQSPRRLLASRLGLDEKETKLVGRAVMTHPATEASSLIAALQKLLPGKDPSMIGSVVEKLWDEQIDCAREIRGAAPLLRALKAEGFKLGALSNIWHPFFLGFSKVCAEIIALLDYTALSYKVGMKKPSVDLYRHAAEITGQPPQKCWMIGDAYELDMAPAQAVGMRTVWVLSRPELERELLVRILRGEKRSPDWVAQDLEEILPFMQKRKGVAR